MTNDPDQALISISTIQEFHAEKPELLYCLSRDQALISSYRFTNLFILFNFSLIFRGGYTLKGYNKEICKQLALNLIFKSVHSWISRSSVQESRLTTKQTKVQISVWYILQNGDVYKFRFMKLCPLLTRTKEKKEKIIKSKKMLITWKN